LRPVESTTTLTMGPVLSTGAICGPDQAGMGCTAHKPELEAAFILSFHGVRAVSLPLPSPGCSHTDIGAGITVTYGSLLRRWSCVEMWCAVPAKLHPNRKSPPRKLYMRKGEYQCPNVAVSGAGAHTAGVNIPFSNTVGATLESQQFGL